VMFNATVDNVRIVPVIIEGVFLVQDHFSRW